MGGQSASAAAEFTRQRRLFLPRQRLGVEKTDFVGEMFPGETADGDELLLRVRRESVEGVRNSVVVDLRPRESLHVQKVEVGEVTVAFAAVDEDTIPEKRQREEFSRRHPD